MRGRLERGLLVAVPFVAMLTVGLGLRLGAGRAEHAALVYAAPSAGAGTGLAWQIVALAEDNGMHAPIGLASVDVIATSAGSTARWQGTTNDDGVAEAELALPPNRGVWIDVRPPGGLEPWASGFAAEHEPVDRPARTRWMPFARRDGAIALDVAVLGQRAAPGFPAQVWVRATDPATRARLADVTVEPEDDPSVATATARARTDANGWAELDVTPVGLAVALRLRAFAAGDRVGTWIGGIFMAPGGAAIETRARWAPDQRPDLAITFAPPRRGGYVEIDNARGRAWAAVAFPSSSGSSGTDAAGTARLSATPLAAGLYWAVAANDPEGAATFGPGTTVRPFFVAANDDDALRFGTDSAECAPSPDARVAPRRLGACLAVAAATPAPRWLALDGFTQQNARSRERRSRGLALALGAVALAILLEALLVLRAAAASRARLRAATLEGGKGPAVSSALDIAVALLVALLGLALLGAFLLRAA